MEPDGRGRGIVLMRRLCLFSGRIVLVGPELHRALTQRVK